MLVNDGKLIHYGFIESKKDSADIDKLLNIYNSLENILKDYPIDCVVIKETPTAIGRGQRLGSYSTLFYREAIAYSIALGVVECVVGKWGIKAPNLKFVRKDEIILDGALDYVREAFDIDTTKELAEVIYLGLKKEKSIIRDLVRKEFYAPEGL